MAWEAFNQSIWTPNPTPTQGYRIPGASWTDNAVSNLGPFEYERGDDTFATTDHAYSTNLDDAGNDTLEFISTIGGTSDDIAVAQAFHATYFNSLSARSVLDKIRICVSRENVSYTADDFLYVEFYAAQQNVTAYHDIDLDRPLASVAVPYANITSQVLATGSGIPQPHLTVQMPPVRIFTNQRYYIVLRLKPTSPALKVGWADWIYADSPLYTQRKSLHYGWTATESVDLSGSVSTRSFRTLSNRLCVVVKDKTTATIEVWTSLDNGTSWTESDVAHHLHYNTATDFSAVMIDGVIYVAYVRVGETTFSLTTFDMYSLSWGASIHTGGPMYLTDTYFAPSYSAVSLSVNTNHNVYLLYITRELVNSESYTKAAVINWTLATGWSATPVVVGGLSGEANHTYPQGIVTDNGNITDIAYLKIGASTTAHRVRYTGSALSNIIDLGTSSGTRYAASRVNTSWAWAWFPNLNTISLISGNILTQLTGTTNRDFTNANMVISTLSDGTPYAFYKQVASGIKVRKGVAYNAGAWGSIIDSFETNTLHVSANRSSSNIANTIPILYCNTNGEVYFRLWTEPVVTTGTLNKIKGILIGGSMGFTGIRIGGRM